MYFKRENSLAYFRSPYEKVDAESYIIYGITRLRKKNFSQTINVALYFHTDKINKVYY